MKMREFFQVEVLLNSGEIKSLLIRGTSGPMGNAVFGRVNHDASDRLVRGVSKIFFRSVDEREDAGYKKVSNAVVGPAFGQSAKNVMQQVNREIPGKKPSSATQEHPIGTRIL